MSELHAEAVKARRARKAKTRTDWQYARMTSLGSMQKAAWARIGARTNGLMGGQRDDGDEDAAQEKRKRESWWQSKLGAHKQGVRRNGNSGGINGAH
jgi:hypothetical protein